jgi:glutathione S-transferase/GST-like protein
LPLTLYYFPTPNGRKISIALEEMGLPYDLVFVNIFANEAVAPDYLEISPNGRIPALVDVLDDGTRVPIFESGAILQYLGRKTGLFYPAQEPARSTVDAWLFWQMAGLGPMSGQITWFKRAAQKPGRDLAETSLAIHRYTKETKRLYGVLDRQLAGRDYICGDYSIADMACWPWVEQHGSYAGDLAEAFPNVAAWHRRVGARPALQRGMLVGTDHPSLPRK